MPRFLIFLLLITLVSSTVLFSGCGRKGCTDPRASNYDEKARKYDGSCEYVIFSRKEMLSHLGNNLIILRYLDLKTKMDDLKAKTLDFTTLPTEQSLNEVRVSWRTTANTWQKCSPFEFGPGEDFAIRSHVNTFPTDTGLINSYISDGSYDLNSFTMVTVKGFPALDFLLYGLGTTDSAVVSYYQSDPLSAQRSTYLMDVVSEMHTRINSVYNGWISSSGNYINTFVNADGTDVGSSLSLLVNQLVYDYELIKNAKIGIPLGEFTLGTPLVNQVEGYYSGFSAEMAVNSIKGIHDLYLGKNETGMNGNSLDDYLRVLNAQGNDGLLADEIDQQFIIATSSLQAITDPLSGAIINNTTVVDHAFTEIKKLVLLIKTQMSSALEVSITFQDDDGD